MNQRKKIVINVYESLKFLIHFSPFFLSHSLSSLLSHFTAMFLKGNSGGSKTVARVVKNQGNTSALNEKFSSPTSSGFASVIIRLLQRE